MIGIVIVSHGRLACELVAATTHVVGEQAQFEAITIEPDDDMDMRRDDIATAVTKCDGGDGVIIMTDMFGGTPSNLAISVMPRGKIEVLAGVNLPMIIKLVEIRGEMTMDEAALAARDAGRKYISIASLLLEKQS